VDAVQPDEWGEDLSPGIFLRLLAQVVVSGASTADSRAVQIVSAQRARARRFDAVFVLGLVEGEFPGLGETPSLLSAGEKAYLDLLAGGLFAPESESERALFVGAASRAWRLLYLSARDAEDDGSEAVPSRFWETAKALLGAGDDGHEGRTLADQVFSIESAPSLLHYRRACVAAGVVAPNLPPEAAAPSWRRAPPRLTDPAVLAGLETVECFSPSALESYARCPFAWFVERVVGKEDLELGLDGRTLGDLIHRTLSECYRSLAADGLLPIGKDDLAEAESRANVIVDGLVQGPECPGTAADRRVAAWKLKSMARRLFGAEASAGGSLVFEEAEMSFGAVEGIDVGGLRVRGRVDRVDGCPDGRGVFVLDYKTGAVPTASAIGTGEGLQLPLYLLALSAERGQGEVVGGAYVSLRDGGLSGVVADGREGLLGSRAGKCRALDDSAWQELLSGSLEVAQAAAAGMRGGAIAPLHDKVCPSWCDLGPACRARRGGYRP
jgi:RecB family exonuclease